MRRESECKDAIIMQMAQANASLSARLPEIEPPAPRDGPETAAGVTGGAEFRRPVCARLRGQALLVA